MKEFTIEEKAKAYDKAISLIKDYNRDEEGFICVKPENIFPELKESEDEKIRNQIINFIEEYGNPIHCEWQKDWIAWLEEQGEQKLLNNDKYQTVSVEILDRLYESEKELEQLKQREQKPAEWSEKDEESTIKDIIEDLEYAEAKGYVLKNNIFLKEINWLKSLNPQSQWKPSDEQMDALHYVTNFDYGGHKATLVSLYEQLKKLKG